MRGVTVKVIKDGIDLATKETDFHRSAEAFNSGGKSRETMHAWAVYTDRTVLSRQLWELRGRDDKNGPCKKSN
jgi:hypothetical protein